MWVEGPGDSLRSLGRASLSVRLSRYRSLCLVVGRTAAGDELEASLARVENVFLKSRRLFNTLEWLAGTSSAHNGVWHGYGTP